MEADTDGYSVFFPDVPGCASGGATLQEAGRNAEAALQAYFDLSEEYNDTLPEPSDLATVLADPDIQIEARLLVRIVRTERRG